MQFSRQTTADGLKALALLGVFMVNGLGYALAPYYPLQLGAPAPIDSILAQTIHVLVLTLLMGKALPFLAFLFGYSMTNYAKRLALPATLKRRQYKLLLVGVLHGVFLYFGDILTSYALVGLWLGGAIMVRGRKLIARWRWWFLLSLGMIVFKIVMEWQHYRPQLASGTGVELQSFAQLLAYGQFARVNATAYFAYLFGWLLSYYAPLHICLFITGILAARYQWLSLQARASTLFQRPWLYRTWPLALLANFLLALASVQAHRQYGLSANIFWITVLNVPLGVWLVASGLTRLMLHIQTKQTIPKWLVWLAPAGRHTLVMYLGLSLTLVLCGRIGWFAAASVWNHTAIWFVALLFMWLAAVALGRAATARHMRDPISRWLSR